MPALSVERRGANLRGWSGRSVAGVVAILFVFFFAIPIV